MLTGSTTNFLISVANVLGVPLGARLLRSNKRGGSARGSSSAQQSSSEILESLKGSRVYEYSMSVIS